MFLAVTPLLPGGTRSAVVRVLPHAGVPLPVKSVVATGGAEENEIRVDWHGGGRATKVAVVAGTNVTTNEDSFHSAWYPATKR